MSSADLATGIVSLLGKRVLVTQAREFMGPVLCSVLAEAGADVVADDSSLIDPGAPAAIVAKAGRVDVLVANLALAAPTTRAPTWTTMNGRRCFVTWSTRCRGSSGRYCRR